MNDLCQYIQNTPASWAAIAAITWPLLSALVNMALRFKTPEEWVAYAEKNPKGAALIRLISATGVDPAKALLHLKALLADKAAPTKALPENSETPKEDNK